MNFDCKNRAIACVGGETLMQYKKQLEECNGDFDLLFLSDTRDNDFYRKVIERGRVYETGYPKCICWKNDELKDCECSRQALIFLYSQLLPNKKVTVEKIQTAREGFDSCKFKIIVE